MGAGRGHPPLPPRLSPRLRRLPRRALLHRLRAAARLGLRRPPAARGVGRVARGTGRGGVPPRAARGGGARDGGDGVARRPNRPGPRRRALRRRPGRNRHRPRPGGPVPRQLLLDERLRPPLLGAHRLDPGAGALGRRDRLWLAFGAVAGLGLLNKISILYLGFGLVVGLVLARRWDVFRSRLFWAGGVLAFAIFLPHLSGSTRTAGRPSSSWRTRGATRWRRSRRRAS